MTHKSLYLFGAALIALVSGCNDTCTENKNALPLAGFYVSDGVSEQSTSVDSLKVWGAGAPGDSILSSARETKTELYLPLRIDSDTTEYYFERRAFGSFSQSKVRFIYSRTPRFASVECGVSYLYGIEAIECSGNLIDSIVCPSGFIDNTNSENLKIYLSWAAQ